MRIIINVLKITIIAIILSMVVLGLFFNSEMVIYNIIGIAIVVVIEVVAIVSIFEELKHALPWDSEGREKIKLLKRWNSIWSKLFT